tara:strand:- start:1133 stop:2077 length:945 start_codon:yes stop_codon:yes gene_type:complete
MKTVVLLSYTGIGSNLLHLSYCHQIAKKYGPITIITLCKNLNQALSKDPLIKEVIYLDKYYKKLTDIFYLSNFLSTLKIDNIFIFYPSIRFFLACKIARIKNIKSYPLFKKKNLHLVNAAKKFTEKVLNIKNCPTESKIFIDKIERENALKKIINNKKNVILGIGSSGPSTRWGSKNFINLMKKLLKKKDDFYFFLLCGPNEKEIADTITKEIDNDYCISLDKQKISEIVPLISLADLYVGNDSFGQHVASQCNIPSIIIMLDTPKAYSDYSINQFRILPENINENDISHDSKFSPDSIKVEQVIEKIFSILKL